MQGVNIYGYLVIDTWVLEFSLSSFFLLAFFLSFHHNWEKQCDGGFFP
jgi:hypothetical protein